MLYRIMSVLGTLYVFGYQGFGVLEMVSEERHLGKRRR